jgi:hypothetical protein
MPNRLAFAAVLAAAVGLGSRTAQAADLFYNYYVEGVNGGPPAQLYISPRPTPAFVGHTYITYQPLMPHEMMYQHHRVYNRYDGVHYLPVNRTTVRWCGHCFPARVCWNRGTHALRLLQHP